MFSGYINYLLIFTVSHQPIQIDSDDNDGDAITKQWGSEFGIAHKLQVVMTELEDMRKGLEDMRKGLKLIERDLSKCVDMVLSEKQAMKKAKLGLD